MDLHCEGLFSTSWDQPGRWNRIGLQQFFYYSCRRVFLLLLTKFILKKKERQYKRSMLTSQTPKQTNKSNQMNQKANSGINLKKIVTKWDADWSSWSLKEVRKLEVSHRHFVDMITIGEASFHNLMNILAKLECLEAASGLQVNLSKNSIA